MLLIKNLRIFHNIIRYCNETVSLIAFLFSINKQSSFEDFFLFAPTTLSNLLSTE